MTKHDKEFKSLALRAGACMLLFLALFVTLTFLYTSTVIFSFSIDNEMLSHIISETILGVGYFLTFSIPAIVFILFSSKESRKKVRSTPRRMTPAIVVFAISTGGFAFSYLNNFMLSFFKADSSDIVAAEPMMIYEILLLVFTSAIVPAIAEEFLFRKTILSNLIPYGKTFAIISSAILFGLMHQNIAQILYTTVAGIIFGYIYVKTESFLCVILIHLLNNLISVLQQAIVSNMSAPISVAIVIATNAIMLILGVLSLFILMLYARKQKDIYETGSFGRLKETSFNYVEKELAFNPTATFFSSPTVLIFTIICVITIFVQFIKL